jgi:hypothetical protein
MPLASDRNSKQMHNQRHLAKSADHCSYRTHSLNNKLLNLARMICTTLYHQIIQHSVSLYRVSPGQKNARFLEERSQVRRNPHRKLHPAGHWALSVSGGARTYIPVRQVVWVMIRSVCTQKLHSELRASDYVVLYSISVSFGKMKTILHLILIT